MTANLETFFENLEQKDFTFSDDLVPHDLVQDLFRECQKSWQEGQFREAHIGRGQEKSRQDQIRGDSTLWLTENETSPASTRFLHWAADFRQRLNERYFLGLKSEEFHFARYPVETGYQKHMDQHRGQNTRKISLVLYLNPGWGENDGGELRIFSAKDENLEIQRILPQPGRLVIFRSDLVPHEVLPCFQTRWSLTGWFRTDLQTPLVLG